MALNNVPTAGQTLFNSRDLINQNFSVINTAFSVNHVPYNDGTGNQGMHQFIQMPAATPTIATAAAQIGLYAKTGVNSAQPELYFQRQSLAANSGYAFTESASSTIGWTRLPSGILLVWGTQSTNMNINGVVTYNFPAAPFPAFTSIFNIQITPMVHNVVSPADPNVAFYFKSATAGIPGTFDVYQHTRGSFGYDLPVEFNYLAIGLG